VESECWGVDVVWNANGNGMERWEWVGSVEVVRGGEETRWGVAVRSDEGLVVSMVCLDERGRCWQGKCTAVQLASSGVLSTENPEAAMSVLHKALSSSSSSTTYDNVSTINNSNNITTTNPSEATRIQRRIAIELVDEEEEEKEKDDSARKAELRVYRRPAGRALELCELVLELEVGANVEEFSRSVAKAWKTADERAQKGAVRASEKEKEMERVRRELAITREALETAQQTVAKKEQAWIQGTANLLNEKKRRIAALETELDGVKHHGINAQGSARHVQPQQRSGNARSSSDGSSSASTNPG